MRIKRNYLATLLVVSPATVAIAPPPVTSFGTGVYGPFGYRDPAARDA